MSMRPRGVVWVAIVDQPSMMAKLMMCPVWCLTVWGVIAASIIGRIFGRRTVELMAAAFLAPFGIIVGNRYRT
jgi:hypothetical protein